MIKDDVVSLLISPTPCSDCRHASRCRREDLACVAFDFYSQGLAPIRWQSAPRVPTRETFSKLFD